jgi:hypothetical protein
VIFESSPSGTGSDVKTFFLSLPRRASGGRPVLTLVCSLWLKRATRCCRAIPLFRRKKRKVVAADGCAVSWKHNSRGRPCAVVLVFSHRNCAVLLSRLSEGRRAVYCNKLPTPRVWTSPKSHGERGAQQNAEHASRTQEAKSPKAAPESKASKRSASARVLRFARASGFCAKAACWLALSAPRGAAVRSRQLSSLRCCN